jgi:hypothetical protein
MSGRPDAEYGVPIPAPYDDPNNWPFRQRTYEGSHEGKVIADELGISVSTVRRAVRWYLKSVQEYDPQTWFAYRRRRKAEGRQWWRAKMDARDQEEKRSAAEIGQARERISAEREALERAAGELHISSSHSDDSARKERKREQQQKLHAKNRRNAGF